MLVVDRFEGRVVVLVDDDERSFDVEMRHLPAGIREGTVLRVPVREGQGPVWGEAVVDDEARSERVREAEGILDELRKRDPGGDVKL